MVSLGVHLGESSRRERLLADQDLISGAVQVRPRHSAAVYLSKVQLAMWNIQSEALGSTQVREEQCQFSSVHFHPHDGMCKRAREVHLPRCLVHSDMTRVTHV